jgi:hypothetical protein
VALLREQGDFADAIERAALALGLHPQFIEKDYWVTEVLRTLNAERSGWFIFKGGTSLSKGYGLIERFSEDVDILVRGGKGDSAKDREQRLKEWAALLAEKLELEPVEYRKPGRGRDASRADLLRFKAVTTRTIQTGIEHEGVLLETGYAGGKEPSEMVRISTMLCGPLDLDPDEFEDTTEFDLPALAPVRTLVEKVAGMHHLATALLDDPNLESSRCGRHYSDIDRLLQNKAVRDELGKRDAFLELVADVELISKRHFDGSTPRPEDGYAAGPAFDPPEEIRTILEARYNEAVALLPRGGTDEWPSFGQTLKRINQAAELL